MTKTKHILLYSTLIFFLQCSGFGGCSLFNKTIKVDEVIKKDEQKIIINENKFTATKKVENKLIKSKKNIKSEKNFKKPIKETIAKQKKIEHKSKKTLPKATYVPFTNAPETIEVINPKYPKHELDNGIEGVVYIQFRIDTSGNVIESYIAKSSENESLDNAALNAVLSSKWQPAKNQGKPVSVWQTLPFEFKLSN